MELQLLPGARRDTAQNSAQRQADNRLRTYFSVWLVFGGNIPIIYNLCLKEDLFHTVSFSSTSFSTAAVAGRLGARDSECLCEMERSCAVAKIIMRTERTEIAINSL